ncbi:MAG: biotin/lipoyl-containing protein, partial [Methylocella sp.]
PARPVLFVRERSVMLGKEAHEVTIDRMDEGLVVRFETTGHAHICRSDWVRGQPVWKGALDGEEVAVQLRPILNGYYLAHGGFAAEARVYTRREAELALRMPEKNAAGGSKLLRSPMPALVKSIEVVAGQAVKAGETLCIIEAMKMETVLRAECDGTVCQINVKPGDSIAVDGVIMAFA